MNPLPLGYLITACIVIVFFVKKDDTMIILLKKIAAGLLFFSVLFALYLIVVFKSIRGIPQGTTSANSCMIISDKC